MCVGAAQGALEYAVRYMNERVVGGRPLAELQGLQWKIADMATQLDGARLLLHRALHLAGPHGTPPALETAMAKAAANLAAKFVCDEAIQLLGGYGYSREYPVERAYRDIRGLCIGAGTVEIQRNFIGSQVVQGATSVSRRLAQPARRRVTLRPTYRHPRARDYLAPGGPWDIPSLDAIVTDAASRAGRATSSSTTRPGCVSTAPRSRLVSARWPAGLRAAGVRRRDVVAWQAPNWYEAVVLYRACWRLGAIAAPVHHQAGPADVDQMLGALDARVWLPPDDLRGPSARLPKLLEAGAPVTRSAARPSDLAVVAVHRRARRGAPKAALHTQRGLAYKARVMVARPRARRATTRSSCRRRSRTSPGCSTRC